MYDKITTNKFNKHLNCLKDKKIEYKSYYLCINLEAIINIKSK